MDASCVWYIELTGAAALATLAAFLDKLPSQPGFLGAELQVSPSQPGLALIASRWQGQKPELSAPAGAKHWVFEIANTR